MAIQNTKSKFLSTRLLQILIAMFVGITGCKSGISVSTSKGALLEKCKDNCVDSFAKKIPIEDTSVNSTENSTTIPNNVSSGLGTDATVVHDSQSANVLIPTPTPAAEPSSTPTTTPSVTSSGIPTGSSYSSSFVVTVSGVSINEYRWALVAQSQDCAVATFSTWLATGVSMSLQVGFRGMKKFCLEGRSDNTGPVVTSSQSWEAKTHYDWDLASAQHLTVEAPLLSAVNDITDCRSKLADSAALGVRPATTAVVNGKIVIVGVCNHPVNGWSLASATWDGVVANATWIDTIPGTTAFDAHWNKNSVIQDPTKKVGNTGAASFAQSNSSQKLYGVFAATGPGPSGSVAIGNYPYEAAGVTSILATNIYNSKNWFFQAAAGTWTQSLSNPETTVDIQANDDAALYFVSSDAASRYHVGVVSFAVTNLRQSNPFPLQPMVSDYRLPKVRNYNGVYYFVGYHTVRKKYELVLGNGPASFDWQNPRELPLENFMTVPGKWFSTFYQIESGVNLPNISGFEIFHDGTSLNAYLIYRAGDYYTNTSTNVRGYGVIRIPVTN